MVGETILSILKERNLPIEWPPLICATSQRDEILNGESYHVEKISDESFNGADVVLFAGKEGARGAGVTWRKAAENAGAISIDNGKDFRLDTDVPLVVCIR
jgi:aspartate-semialdehyde dehydrogenase